MFWSWSKIFLSLFFFSVLVIKFKCLKLFRQCVFYILFIFHNSKIYRWILAHLAFLIYLQKKEVI